MNPKTFQFINWTLKMRQINFCQSNDLKNFFIKDFSAFTSNLRYTLPSLIILMKFFIFFPSSWKWFGDICTDRKSFQIQVSYWYEAVYGGNEVRHTKEDVWGCCQDSSHCNCWNGQDNGRAGTKKLRCLHMYTNPKSVEETNQKQCWHWNWNQTGN